MVIVELLEYLDIAVFLVILVLEHQDTLAHRVSEHLVIQELVEQALLVIQALAVIVGHQEHQDTAASAAIVLQDILEFQVSTEQADIQVSLVIVA